MSADTRTVEVSEETWNFLLQISRDSGMRIEAIIDDGLAFADQYYRAREDGGIMCLRRGNTISDLVLTRRASTQTRD